jgi:hypothetical protein
MRRLGQLLGLRRNEMDCDALEGARDIAGVLFYDEW